MPKAIPSYNFQKRQAIAFNKEGNSIREVPKMLEVTITAILNFHSNPEHHGTKKELGKPKALTPRDERNIIQELKKKYFTVSEVQIQEGLKHMSGQTNYI